MSALWISELAVAYRLPSGEIWVAPRDPTAARALESRFVPPER